MGEFIHPPINTRDKTEAWMERMGTSFIQVRFHIPKADGWYEERQVADVTTLLATIDMTASRVGARAAVWPDLSYPGDGGWWCWRFKVVDVSPKLFPTKEAAEMYAIHTRG